MNPKIIKMPFVLSIRYLKNKSEHRRQLPDIFVYTVILRTLFQMSEQNKLHFNDFWGQYPLTNNSGWNSNCECVFNTHKQSQFELVLNILMNNMTSLFVSQYRAAYALEIRIFLLTFARKKTLQNKNVKKELKTFEKLLEKLY